jgi:hypothetical protein
MHAVAMTRAFERAASDAGMTEDEIANLVDFLAVNPAAGEVMVGTGGCRKVRVAGRGRGRSGGYRAITFYTGESLPLFLITVFAKGEKSNLSKSERNRLHDVTKAIVREYRRKIAALTKKGA